jgi:hypothetical protein
MSPYDDAAEAVLVPDIFVENLEGDTVYPLWWLNHMDDLPSAGDTRDTAIETILDCESSNQEPPEEIPSKLIDAWVTEKRSREYLNDEMDKLDLDAIYFAAAYKDEE